MLLAETAARTHSAFKKTKGRSLRFHVSSYQISSESATLIGLVDKALRFRRGDVFLSVAFKEIVFEAATPQLGMCYAYVMDGQTGKITILRSKTT